MHKFWSRFNLTQSPRRDDGYCYLFLHIAKCAGSTITERLGSLGRSGIHLYEKVATKAELRDVFRHKMAQAQISPADVRVVYGHRVFTGLSDEVPRRTRLTFLLRDPTEMLVSLYNYQGTIAQDPNHANYERERKRMLDGRDRVIPFRDWLEIYPVHNQTMNFLYHAVAGDLTPGDGRQAFDAYHLNVCKAAIDEAHFVGFVDSLQSHGPAMLRIMRVRDPTLTPKNVSRKFFNLSSDPGARRLIEDRHALDCELYRYAVARRARSVA